MAKGAHVKDDHEDYPVAYLWYVFIAFLGIALAGALAAVFML
jgi:hypothetical protein